MYSSYIKATLFSVCLTGIFFSALTFLLAAMDMLYYDSYYINHFIPPLISLVLYQLLNSKFSNSSLEKYSLLVSNILLGLCMALLFFGYLKWYTLIITLILVALLLYIEYINRLRFMYYFYRLYIVLMIPFYLACRWIMNNNILKVDVNETLKLKLAEVSIESFFYLMAMLLMTVYLFEFFKYKLINTDG